VTVLLLTTSPCSVTKIGNKTANINAKNVVYHTSSLTGVINYVFLHLYFVTEQGEVVSISTVTEPTLLYLLRLIMIHRKQQI